MKMSNQPTKQCCRCKEIKSVSEFFAVRKSKDGLSYFCKSCRNEEDRRNYIKKVGEKNYKIKKYSNGYLKKILKMINVLTERALTLDEKKYCTKCKEVKPFSEFQKNSRGKHGLQSYCRDCHKVAVCAVDTRKALKEQLGGELPPEELVHAKVVQLQIISRVKFIRQQTKEIKQCKQQPN